MDQIGARLKGEEFSPGFPSAHCRESGIPELRRKSEKVWAPACAGTNGRVAISSNMTVTAV
jgi:hypothetical protein